MVVVQMQCSEAARVPGMALGAKEALGRVLPSLLPLCVDPRLPSGHDPAPSPMAGGRWEQQPHRGGAQSPFSPLGSVMRRVGFPPHLKG